MQNEPAKPRKVPAVARVCPDDTLVELVYDPAKRTTALAVSRFGGLWNVEQEIRIDTGDNLVPYSASNNLIAHDCVLLPSTVEQSGTKADLIADIHAYLRRYVDLSPGFELVAAYYILLSWVHDAFNEVPYLRLVGDFGTGKTRALMTIGSVCYRPFFASGASTVSPIFHTLDAFGGTLVLDEADLPYSDAKADLVKLLNNGTVKGMPVLRTLQNKDKEFNPYAFRVFGPKIVAAREPFQDRGLESRFFTEETGTRPLRSDIPIQLPTTLKEEALRLRNRLLHFRFEEFVRIRVRSSASVQGLGARASQMALPLLSLVEDAAAREEIEAFLKAQSAKAAQKRQEALDGRVLAALLRMAAKQETGPLSLKEIGDAVNETGTADGEPSYSYKAIGTVLRNRLGIEPRRGAHGFYTVPMSERPKFAALAARFGIAWPAGDAL
jgi:hypothetical protein